MNVDFFMVGLLTEVILRRLPTRDDRLQEDRLLIFDERHQIRVVLTPDDEDALAAVTLGVRVLQDIEQVATLKLSHCRSALTSSRRVEEIANDPESWPVVSGIAQQIVQLPCVFWTPLAPIARSGSLVRINNDVRN